jgi:hypothetical protein
MVVALSPLGTIIVYHKLEKSQHFSEKKIVKFLTSGPAENIAG